MTRPANGRRITVPLTARRIDASTAKPDAGPSYPPEWLPAAQRRAIAAGAKPSPLFGR